MTEIKQLQEVSLEEFEAMEKDKQFNYELLDGIVLMSPSPSFEHQEIAGKLYNGLFNKLSGILCKVIYEFDIKYKGNILKPDIMIFCNNNRELPDIVFEILSPSTRQHDLLYKPFKYQQMGVKEYWIVDPKMKSITVHDFVNATAETYGIGETIQSLAHTEIIVSVADIFAS